jgi:hypothetical protein
MAAHIETRIRTLLFESFFDGFGIGIWRLEQAVQNLIIFVLAVHLDVQLQKPLFGFRHGVHQQD